MSDNKPLISVIVPVYNVEKYLKQCIDSIINQTYKNLEIILVNDGSKDNSGIICDEYSKKDSRIKVIHQENKGASVARNRGIKESKGEYISFIDSDDFITNDMLDILLSMCIENQCGISKCETIDIKDRNMPKVSRSNNVKVYDSNYILNDIYEKKPIFNPAPCNKLYKRNLFDKIKFEEGIIYEDEAIMCQLIFYAQKIAITNDILYCYFLSPKSVMRSSFSEKRFDILKAFEIRMKFLRDKNLNDIYLKTQVRYSYFISNLYYNLWKNNLHKNEKYSEHITQKKISIKEELNNNKFYTTKQKFMEQLLVKYPYIYNNYNIFKDMIKKIVINN